MYNQYGEELSYADMHEEYDEMLNTAYGSAINVGVILSASDILRECDEVAYDEGFNNFESEQIENDYWFEDDPAEEDEALCDTCGEELDADDDDQMSELQCAEHLSEVDNDDNN